MNLSDAKVMLCNCDGTMSLDGTKLAKACGAEGGCTIATSLCRTETGDLAAAMRDARDANQSLLIACTQETSVFDAIAEEIECPSPATVNIRERAGWSDESATSTAKIAALIKQAGDGQTPSRSLALNSDGRCLIYADMGRPNGGADAAIALGQKLNGELGVTVMIANPTDDLFPTKDCSILATGKIKSAKGHFTHFDLVIDQFGAAEIARRSRGTPRIANRLLRRVRDYSEVKSDGAIGAAEAAAALDMLSIDSNGFDHMDRRLLMTMIEKFDGGPVGIDSLAAAISEERDTIEDVLEPYLIQQGFIMRTPRGRVVTQHGYRHFGLKPNQSSAELFDSLETAGSSGSES